MTREGRKAGTEKADRRSRARKAGAETSYVEDSIIYTGGEYRDHAFKYRLLLPADHDPEAAPSGRSWPLILFLHGAGERGSDNAAQLKYLPEQMALPENRERYRAFVLAPQCPANRTWSAVDMKTMVASRSAEPTDEARTVLAMLDDVMRKHPVDPRRVTLTGLSMGGYGAWDLAARCPQRWAAVVFICGGGDPGTAARMKDLPIWAFQGAKDPVVPPERSREMVEAVRRAGGKPRYTEYPDVAHDSWTPAYRDRISSRGSSRRGSRVAHEGRAPGRLRPRAFARAARLRPSDGREGMRNPRFPRGKILGVISRCSTSSLEVASLTSGFFVASCLCTMHDTRMSTKTISLKLEAYERLRRARRHPAESFSEVILRAVWPGQTLTGAELLELIRKRGPSFGEAGLARIEAAKRGDRPPEDKWGAD